MARIIGPDFFNRKAPVIARELIGQVLVRQTSSGVKRLEITEVEAYCGFDDLASHARFGKTKRNTPMFGPPAVTYIYFTYGIHWLLNIVCGPEDYPSAVLIRAAGGIVGPARLTKALQIDGIVNNQKLGKELGLWIEGGRKVPPSQIIKTPRVGIAYAGTWVEKPWRFVLKETRTKK